MPGYKVVLQDGGELREGLSCSYCKLLLKDAVQTSETGQRLCRECFEKATKDPAFAGELDQNDEIWPDSAVKREIGNLKVKCENYSAGCDWKGLFKQLMQHSQECQYVTVKCRNPGCGQQVLLTEMESHLTKQCPQRRVNCKDCGKEMCFIELQSHSGQCPNAPKACKNCKKKIPTSMLADHMMNECKHVRCVCKDESKTYEAGSKKFHDHLQNVGKLADHLGPMIIEFSKMSEAFKEMTVAYQQTSERIVILEKSCQESAQRIKTLENRNDVLEENAKQARIETAEVSTKLSQFEKKTVVLERKVEILEKENNRLSQEISSQKTLTALVPKDPENDLQQLEQQFIQRIGILEKHWSNLNDEIRGIRNSMSKNNTQVSDEIENLKRHYTLSISSSTIPTIGNEVVPYEKPSLDVVKQVEEKMLELERTLNVISVHHSELELQLQASLASTHNGAFLWRIPEVRRRIRDAKIGRITSIYSPPFYTGRNGYKMCIRAYLNGDGTGEGTHLSIFFVLMKGEYDPLLQWPFEPKVSLILVDQDHMKHIVQTFKPNPQSSSFQQPKTDMNVASGCPEFADLSILENTSYVKEDVMYIKAIADTSKIFHP